jgi:hypothetical protein
MDHDLFLTLGDIEVKNEEVVTEAVVVPVVTEPIKAEEVIAPVVIEPKEEFANKQFEKTNEEIAPSSESNDSSSTISVFANYLKEEGVLSSELEGFEKVDSLEDLKNLVMKQIESEKHSNLSETQKRYLDSIESGIPLNEYESMQKELSWIESISIDDLNDESEAGGQLRFDIMVMDLIESGMDQDKAVVLANRSFELKKDKEDAADSIQSLYNKKVETYNASVEEKKVEKQASIEDVRKTIDAKEFIMGDIKLTKETKSEILKLMTTQVDTTPEGQPLNQFGKWRRENGVEAEIILNALFINTNGFKNLGDIKTQVSSDSARKLEDRLRSLDKEDLSRSAQSGSKSGMTLQ